MKLSFYLLIVLAALSFSQSDSQMETTGIKKIEKNYGKIIRENSRKNNFGLFQLNIGGWEIGHTEKKLLDARRNIKIAIKKLADLFQKYGDAKIAVITFGNGSGKIDSLIKISEFNRNSDEKIGH